MADGQQIQSAVPSSQQPPGATSMREGSDGKMYFYDIAGKQLGPAPESIQQEDQPEGQIQGVPKGLVGTPVADVPEGLIATPVKPSAPAVPAADAAVEGVPSGLIAKPTQAAQPGYVPKIGDYQIRKGGPVINIITAGQKPGTITVHNPIVPLPGEEFEDTMKRAVEAGKSVTPEQIKEEQDEAVRNAPGTLASAFALGATGPVIYGGAKGISILKQAIVGGDSQILGHPENLLTPESKKAHPYWAGALELGGSLSNPETAAMLIGSGGLGKLPGAAQKITARLVSAGFAIPMITNAVRNSGELWDVMQGKDKYADMSLDDRESVAKGLVFKIATEGGMAVAAGEHAIRGEAIPLTGISETAGRVAGSVAEKVGDTFKDWHNNRTEKAETAKNNEEAKSAREDFKKIAPPTKAAPYEDKDLIVGDNYIEHHHANVEPINDIGDMRDALEYERQGIENKVTGLVAKYAKEPLAEGTNVKADVRKSLAEIDKIKAGFLDDGMKALEDYNLTDPSMEEADAIRRQLNAENRATEKKNQWDRATARATDPAYAAREAAVESLREGIYNQLEAKGVVGAKEMRQDEASLIRLRNAVERQIFGGEKVARGSSEAGPIRKLAAKGATLAGAGVGALAGTAAGLPGGPEAGAILGGYAGKKVGEVIAPPDLTRDALVQRRMGKKVATGVPTELEGIGKPSTPPSAAAPPGPGFAEHMGPELEKLYGEFTPLHGDLATHYGEMLGDSTYAELAGRFLADIAVKKEHKVPLDPAEKKLLTGINQAKVEETLRKRGMAEEQRKAAQKAADEAQKQKEEKEKLGLKTNMAPPFAAEPHIELPDEWKEMGKTPEMVAAHELGHHFQIAKYGNPTLDVISHEHPSIDEGTAAEARWVDDKFRDERGHIDLDKIKDNIDELLDILHGGPVAEEIIHGIPIHENAGAGSDLDTMETSLIVAGFTPSEASQLMMASEQRVRNDFMTPGVSDIFKRYSQARETGLRPGILISEKTSGRAIQEFKNAIGGGNEGGNEPKTFGGAGKGNTKGKTGGIGAVSSGRAEGTRPAGETGASAGRSEGKELRTNLKDKETPKITDIIPELKEHPEIEQKIKDLGFEGVLQKEWVRQKQEKTKAEGYKPSEKAVTLAGPQKDLGPEFRAGQVAHELERNKAILRNPDATPEEKEIAQTRINETKPLPPERTTGIAERDDAIKEGGGIPGGVSDLGEFGKIINFHDPKTGSTLGFKEGSEITPETVKAQIQKSRKAYGLKTEMATSEEGDYTPDQKKAVASVDSKYETAGDEVDGRKIRDEVPNFSSINATLGLYPGAYDVLDGIREIPMSAFDDPGAKTPRAKELANQIKQSKELNPLIVGEDKNGPYIIEGSHRFDALRMLGAKSFPAVVAVDLTEDTGVKK